MTGRCGLQSRQQGDARDRGMMWHLSPPDYWSASVPQEWLSNFPASPSVESRASVPGAEVLPVGQMEQGPVPQLTTAALALQTLH